MIKIKIWGVTVCDTAYSMLYKKVSKFEIIPKLEYDEEDVFEQSITGFDLVIYQGKEATKEELSINTTFKYDQKEKQLYVEFHDY